MLYLQYLTLFSETQTMKEKQNCLVTVPIEDYYQHEKPEMSDFLDDTSL